ncbi:Ring type e3 ligase [Thalictrum thalictroides]|uniref:Ring type e3 ligase n=1 Tax=Thalictrum thalictroides TaxID=46969 RepID=A0A7J6XEL7_THATH|nr:Ring type e3 ligase [Thalictrum thalictroides]
MSSEKSKGSNGENSPDISSPALVEEKGSRNKRKFTSDPPVGDLNKPPSCSKNECQGYEFSAERFQNIPKHEQCGLCDTCRCNQDNPDASKLELIQSHPEESATLESVQPIVEQESKLLLDADWSDLTETQLEELCLNNLDLIFRSVIKTIVASGYSEDVATKAVLRLDLSYGCKDTMSNVVDNTLAVLESGRELDASREHIFENLEQLEKYILAEMVCVLREVSPHFNTGDAMWCLLIYDMNVSLACAMDGDSLSSLGSNGDSGESSSASMVPKLKEDIIEDITPNTTNTNSPVVTPKGSQPEMPAVKGIPNLPNPCERRLPEKTNPTSTSDNIKKALAVIDERIQVKSQSYISSEKPVVTRKGQASGVKKETILRQKIQYRGALRTGKLSGLNGFFMDKKLKSVSDSMGIHSKNASMKIKKAIEVNIAEAEENFHQMKKTMEVTIAQAEGSCHLSVNVGTSKSTTSKKKTVNNPLVLPDDTEQTLTPPSKSNAASNPTTSSAVVHDFSHYGIPYDKATGKWVPNDKQDAAILKLVANAQELQNQLGEWTDWANQKVMQATRRLSKDKAELKALKQEKEDVERIQKERQSQEEGNVKQLSEMENALSKATGQVEKVDATVRKLEAENSKLKQGMEEAKKRYAEASESYREVSRREKKIIKKLQSLERQNTSLQEDLAMLKRRRGQLEQEVEQARRSISISWRLDRNNSRGRRNRYFYMWSPEEKKENKLRPQQNWKVTH